MRAEIGTPFMDPGAEMQNLGRTQRFWFSTWGITWGQVLIGARVHWYLGQDFGRPKFHNLDLKLPAAAAAGLQLPLLGPCLPPFAAWTVKRTNLILVQ